MKVKLYICPECGNQKSQCPKCGSVHIGWIISDMKYIHFCHDCNWNEEENVANIL